MLSPSAQREEIQARFCRTQRSERRAELLAVTQRLEPVSQPRSNVVSFHSCRFGRCSREDRQSRDAPGKLSSGVTLWEQTRVQSVEDGFQRTGPFSGLGRMSLQLSAQDFRRRYV